MKNDEKFCPLCSMTCKGEECGWWHITNCAVIDAVRCLNSTNMELFHLRTEATFIRKELESR